MRSSLFAGFAIFVLACGPTSSSPSATTTGTSPPPPPATEPPPAPSQTAPASGTVAGHAFTFVYGIAYPRQVSAGDGYEIFLSDKPIDCTNATLEGAKTVDIDVAGRPPATGTYPIVEAFERSAGATEAEVDFNAEDPTCGSLASETSVSGTLVLSEFDMATVQGTIDVTFENGSRKADGRIAGAFHATVCAGPFPTLTCKPH